MSIQVLNKQTDPYDLLRTLAVLLEVGSVNPSLKMPYSKALTLVKYIVRYSVRRRKLTYVIH